MNTASLELLEPPTDSISSLQFSPIDPCLLLVSSWDYKARLYNVGENKCLGAFEFRGPLLDAEFSLDGQVGLVGGLDRTLSCIDLETGQSHSIGTHNDAIKSIHTSRYHGSVLTGSWDKTLTFWDTRLDEPFLQQLILPQKVIAMDSVEHLLVLGLGDRQVQIYDLRQLKSPLEKRVSPLKYMTRTLKCMPNGQGFVMSSIEGRIAVEQFDKSPVGVAKNYAFKCHRQNVQGVDTVYPVHALAFHPVYGTFASGGGDGFVNLWDSEAKKRIKQYPKFPQGISSLSFNADATSLAIACSYSFEQGPKQGTLNAIHIRPVQENEFKPKS